MFSYKKSFNESIRTKKKKTKNAYTQTETKYKYKYKYTDRNKVKEFIDGHFIMPRVNP